MTSETPRSRPDAAPGLAEAAPGLADATADPANTTSDLANTVPDPTSTAPGLAEDPGGMEHRSERIRIETERHRIVGTVRLARDGYRSRVSDVLNAPERDFLTLTDATIEPLDGGPVELHTFLTVARRHIVFAVAAPQE